MLVVTLTEGSVLWFFIRNLDLQCKHSWGEQLNLNLAQRSLDAEQVKSLAYAMAQQERYEGGVVSDKTIDALLEGLKMLPSLSGHGEEEEFLYWLAERHSLKLYHLFLRRIEIAEKSLADSMSSYEAMPFYRNVSLQGLVGTPEFEKVAHDLLDTIFTRPHKERQPWCRLFVAAVSRTSSLIESLLTERLNIISTKEDLVDLVSLLQFERSVITYRYPRLVECILTKARTSGPTAAEDVMWRLIHASQPTMRGYTSGELSGEFRYAIMEA